MASALIYDQNKHKVGEISLSDDVFQAIVKPEILHLAVRSHLAKLRAGTVGVKTRGLVSGGGKKPWRQKGTGRARAGSTRSPLWRSGAVIHGPQSRDYSFKINKQVRKQALKMALSSRFMTDALLVIDKFKFEKIKTKNFVECLKNLGLKKALIVVGEEDSSLSLSARNVPGVCVMDCNSVNVYEILKYPQMVIDSKAVASLQERLR